MSAVLNIEKATQTILYICKKTEGVSSFGNVLLNKALYFIDHTSFLKTGSPITGFEYIKQRRGPTPAPGDYLSIRSEMLVKHQIREKEIERFGYLHKKTVAKVPPNISSFSPQEIALMDDVIEELSGTSASAVSEQTHEMLAWKIADLMESLPLYTYLLTEADLTETDIAWGDEIFETRKAA